MGTGASAIANKTDDEGEEGSDVKMTSEQTTKFAEDMNLCEFAEGETGQKLYQSLKGKDGLVSSRSLKKMVSNSIELEMLTVFTEYSVGDGILMDNAGFVELLRDAKILSKHDLPMHYVNMIFKEHSAQLDPPKRLNYGHFREVVVPAIAEKKKMSVDHMLAKFCRLEHRKAAEAAVVQEEKEEELRQSMIKKKNKLEPSPECHAAAKKLQARTRQRQADKRISFMRQCSEAREDPQLAAALEDANIVQQEEQATSTATKQASLKAMFTRYCESCASHYQFVRSLRHETDMERKQFVSMCTDAKLLNHTRFTVNDCNEVFDKAIAIALNPASDPQHRADVFFGKRIGFTVFRDIAISCLAEKTRLSTQAIIVLLLATPDKAMVKKKMRLEDASGRSVVTTTRRVDVEDSDE